MLWLILRSLYLIALGLAWSSGQAHHIKSSTTHTVPESSSVSLLSPRMPLNLKSAPSEIQNLAATLSKPVDPEISEGLTEWIEMDPKAMATLLIQHSAPDHGPLLRSVMAEWSHEKPAEANQWLAHYKNIPHLDRAIQRIVPALAHAEPNDATQWMQRLRDPSILTPMWAAHGFQLYRHNHSLA